MITAQELTDALTTARNAEYGNGVYGFPSQFFNLNVWVTQPGGTTVQRSPRYCATQYGAEQVAEVLSGRGLVAKLVQAPAMGYEAKGGFSDSEQVPYLVFAGDYEGAKVNAAILLDCFNHGIPGVKGLNNAQLEVFRVAAEAAGREVAQTEVEAILAQTV